MCVYAQITVKNVLALVCVHAVILLQFFSFVYQGSVN